MRDRATDIAARACAMQPSARAAFLDKECAGDDALRAAVEAIIRDSESVTLDRGGAAPDSADSTTDSDDAFGIEGFTIIEPIGSGAMGTVYLAEQARPTRRVALKIMHADAMDEQRRRRFAFESESLAKLRHPGIATIYQVGQGERGGASFPYFAMELVEGRPLDEHAPALTTRARIALVAEICDAIEHAHHRGIVHRDLKPSNIMVDRDGRAKVLDFGVARSLDPEARVAELVGTVPYMSPEQLRRDPDIDWRTDVYALGVILHEIVAGRRPRDLRDKTIEQAIEAVESAPPALDPSLGRELRAIVDRALRTDRDERYASARELGADLRRYLRGEPVEALGGGRLYRTGKFARRNAIPVALSGAAVLALIGGVIGTGYQAARATRGWDTARQERRAAEVALQRAVASNTFLTDMLVSADPESTLGAELTVREVLDTASLTIERELESNPAVHASVRMALSNTYLQLGELQASREHAREMLGVCRERLGEDHHLTADARRTLAGVLMQLGSFERAQELLDDAREAIVAYGDPVELAKLESETARAMHLAGRTEESLGVWSACREKMEQHLGPDHKETLIVMHNIGIALKDMGRLQESEDVMRRVAERRSATMGDDHPQTLIARDVLAGVIQKQGRDAEAAGMLRDVMERRLRVLGEDHFSTLLSMGNLGVALIRLGELDEAERLTRRALAGHRERFGDTHAKTLVLMGNLAYLLEDRGAIDEAAALYRETIDAQRTASGGVDPETWAPMNNLAMLLMNHGRAGEARALFEELLTKCDAALPQGHYYTALFRNNYAECLHLLGDHEASLDALNASHPVLVQTFGEGHERVERSAARREAALDALGRCARTQKPRARVPGARG